MYKFLCYNKKILIVLLFILINTMISIKSMQANEQQSPIQNISTPEGIKINIPHENIKKIPIIGYTLVYQTVYGSLIDFLDKEIETLKNELSKAGIQNKNIVLIYTDYVGDSPSKYNLNQFSNKSTLTPEELSKFKTDEGIEINLTFINKKFSLPFLLTKRKVLIGTLINNNLVVNNNSSLKVIKFNIPNAMGFQAYVNQNTNNKQNVNNTFTKEEIILNRCAMIQYMNLSFNNKTNFIGMMEYYDITNNMYDYFSLPENQE